MTQDHLGPDRGSKELWSCQREDADFWETPLVLWTDSGLNTRHDWAWPLAGPPVALALGSWHDSHFAYGKHEDREVMSVRLVTEK